MALIGSRDPLSEVEVTRDFALRSRAIGRTAALAMTEWRWPLAMTDKLDSDVRLVRQRTTQIARG